jgi:hypothetical protein
MPEALVALEEFLDAEKDIKEGLKIHESVAKLLLKFPIPFCLSN